MRAHSIAVLIVAALALSGCAALTGDRAPGLTGIADGDVAARAGAAEVTVDELEAEVEEAVAAGFLQSENYSGSEVERQVQLQNRLLNELFAVELLVAAAAEDFDIAVDDAEVDGALDRIVEGSGGLAAFEQQLAAQELTLSQARRQQLATLLVERVSAELFADEPVTDDEVRAAFEQRQAQFQQVSASHILVETEAEAQDVIARLEEGEDFAALAQELSQDPGSAEAGGSLGLAPRGTFVQPFEDAIWSGPAEVGEILGPVQTQFGFHVIRVDEFQTTSEADALEQIRGELESTRGQELFGVWFQQVRADAEPQVAGRFGEWSRTDQAILLDAQREASQQ